MTENRDGQVVTFYSYKGGTGRTMALANVAWILAANGYRVLVVDWDLESPGLHRYFAPFINPEALASTGGVIELIGAYEWATTADDPNRGDRWHEHYARVQPYSFSLDWQFPGEGTLDFLSAGKERPDYTAALFGLRWDEFYEKRRGGQFLDALRADMRANYDFTLIDSRTGQSDVAEICTSHLPDIVVDCFTLSEQGIDGAVQIARRIERKQDRPIQILPVPMRIDPAEKEKADAGRAVAKQRFAGLPANLTEAERDTYWAGMQVPYQAYYVYEESLATFAENPATPGTLLSAYAALTSRITGGAVQSLPPMDENTRARVIRRFARRSAVVEDEVALRYLPQDQVWAEWIEHVLVTAGVRVHTLRVQPGAPEPVTPPSARTIKILSRASANEEADLIPMDRGGGRDPLAIYVADLIPLNNAIPMAHSTFIAGVSIDVAVDNILRLVGRPNTEVDTRPGAPGPRFPGLEPVAFNVPARNARFTGRESDLEKLRLLLRSGGGTAVVISSAQPVALQGMGGIGKTQVAIEYAYRFRSAYDVVWWINSDPYTFVDSALVDLGEKLGVQRISSSPENVRNVLTALSKGDPYSRWLLIYDNAEDPRVGELLPQGKGHVIITSRGSTWGERAQTMPVDVFQRRESIAHLSTRMPSIKRDEADRVAEALGDLPIAIAAAGAWLADTGTPVDDYLHEIERLGPRGMRAEGSEGMPDRSVEATWDLSLHRLNERSPAAYRLLQLCSVLAPEISLELVYSDEIAQRLASYDPAVSERMMRGTLVQQVHRLALLRLDSRSEGSEVGERPRGGQVLVHRLLQHVVRARMSEEELAATRHEIHLVLAASRPAGEVDDPDTWLQYRRLWPHLEISEAEKCPDESVRRLMIDRVRYLWLRGDLERGRNRAESTALAWTAMLEDPATPDRTTLRRQLLHLRTNQANLVRDLGEFQASFDLDSASLAEQRELVGPDHPHTLMSASGLAADLRSLGRYREALELDIKTHAQWLDLFGELHPRTLSALNNLAVSYRLVGEFVQALTLDEQVYQLRRRVVGENHPSTLASAGNLARDLRDAGEYDRSIALLRAVSESIASVLGPEARQTLNLRVNLAVSLRTAGQVREADPLFESAYERLNALFSSVSPDTLAARLSRGANLHSVGEYVRADRELTLVGEQYNQVLGPRHPHTLASILDLAVAKRGIGELRQAAELGRQAADDFAEVLGPEHPYSLAAAMNLGVYLADTEALEEAERLLRDVVKRTVPVLGPDHPNTLRCQANLALVLRRLDRSDPEFVETVIYDRMVRRVGLAHPAPSALRDRELLERVIDPHPF